MFELFSFTDSRTELFGAIVKAQSEMGAATKDSKNPHFKSTYASLPAVLDAITPVLNRNGLAMMQLPTFDGDTIVQVTTVVIHVSGQMMSSTVGTPIAKRDPQGVGSAITYLRRYAAQSIFALPVEDDDGNAASYRPNAQPPAPAQAPPPKAGKPGPGTMKVVNDIKALLESNGLKVSDFDAWASKGKRPPLEALDLEKLQACRAWLEKGGVDSILAASVAK